MKPRVHEEMLIAVGPANLWVAISSTTLLFTQAMPTDLSRQYPMLFPQREHSQSSQHDLKSFSRAAMVIISWNDEGISKTKGDLIPKGCAQRNCDVLCRQEIHRGPNHKIPRIHGMKLVIESTHEKYGNAIFEREIITIDTTSTKTICDIEILIL
jgi:hypothetical protein